MSFNRSGNWSNRHLLQIDWVLIASALVICAVGVCFIWSASFHRNEHTGAWEQGAQPLRQIMWVGISLIALVVMLILPYTVLMRFSYPLYIAGLLLLVGVLFHPPIKEVRRWYSLGGVLFQPSEYMKVILIMTLARYLMYRENYRTLKGLLGPFLLTFAPVLLVVQQPDLGTALVFIPILFVLLYVAGARRKHLIAVILIGIAMTPVVYLHLEHYQQQRILSFISPSDHPRHVQSGGYQVTNSLCAIGSGQLTGRGWGDGPLHRHGFIPAAGTDFIFAVVGEEWGFAGGVGLLLLYCVLFLCGLGIAKSTREPYGRLVAVGVVTMLAMQVFTNVAMTVQLMPVTGLPLPFMSYGGSSLLSSFIALGLLINVGKNRIPVFADEDFK